MLLPGLLLSYMNEFVSSPASLWISLFFFFLTEFFLLNYMDVLIEIMSMIPSLMLLFWKLQHDCLLQFLCSLLHQVKNEFVFWCL